MVLLATSWPLLGARSLKTNKKRLADIEDFENSRGSEDPKEARRLKSFARDRYAEFKKKTFTLFINKNVEAGIGCVYIKFLLRLRFKSIGGDNEPVNPDAIHLHRSNLESTNRPAPGTSDHPPPPLTILLVWLHRRHWTVLIEEYQISRSEARVLLGGSVFRVDCYKDRTVFWNRLHTIAARLRSMCEFQDARFTSTF